MAMSPRLLRPLASGFNPRQIAGLAAWWDSTDNSTITTDTGVSAWQDKVNGYTLSQDTGANQPTLSSINGKQAFDYNGLTHWLESTDAGLLAEANGSSVNDTTMFYVGEIEAFTGTAYGVTFASSTSNTPVYAALQAVESGSVWRVFYRGDLTTPATIVESTSQYSLSSPYVISQLSSSSLVARANGAEVVSTTNTAAAENITLTRLGVGALARTAIGNYWNGRIGDVLIYDRVLTTAEIQRVEQWLAGKFGVTLT